MVKSRLKSKNASLFNIRLHHMPERPLNPTKALSRPDYSYVLRAQCFTTQPNFSLKTLSPWSKEADSYISDSTDFCNKICGISDPCQLVSYDVVDLFTNVPIQQALDVINEKLMNST